MGRQVDKRGQWLKGLLELCVLGILSRGEAYGYDISGTLADAGIGEVKGGTLYPALAKLEDEGLVSPVWRSGDGGPNRKYYRITDQGRVVLADDGARWFALSQAAAQLIGEQEGAGT